MRQFFTVVLRSLVVLLILALLLAPMVCIYTITDLEMAQYNEVDVPAVVQKAYGTIEPVLRLDMPEFITVSGTYVSTETFFMELPVMKKQYSARLLVSVGDYIEEGTLLGYTEDGEKEIVSTAAGLVKEFHFGTVSYVQLENPDSLALECQVSETTLSVLKRSDLNLSDQNGNTVEILELGKRADQNGVITVRLRLSGGLYGAQEKSLVLYTGRVFTQALVVPTGCLFHMEDDPKTWYVRVVDESDKAVGNQEVQVGFTDGNYTCVSGIEEGTLLDSGYARIFGA